MFNILRKDSVSRITIFEFEHACKKYFAKRRVFGKFYCF